MSTPRKDVADDETQPSKPGDDVSEDRDHKGEQQAQPAGQGGPPDDHLAGDTKQDEHKEESPTSPPQPAEPEPEDEEIPYPEPQDDEPLLPPPDFKPFFTLIEDETGEHHHPTVHYIFADDEDTDILTNAALQTLNEAEQPQQENDEPNERFVVLDLDPTGKEVISAKSLSPEWQALKTQISPAPSWGGSDEKSAERGLMLRILGQEASRREVVLKEKVKGDVSALLKVFDDSLDGLMGVLGTSDKDTHDDDVHDETITEGASG